MAKLYNDHLQDAEAGNGWAETRDLCPTDQRLRAAGFRIHARPKDGPAVWARTLRRKGEHVTQFFSQPLALEILDRLKNAHPGG